MQACYNLAQMYENGENVEKDIHEARELYTIASEEGHLPSKHSLAFIYAQGIGVPVDKARAEALFEGRNRAEKELFQQALETAAVVPAASDAIDMSTNSKTDEENKTVSRRESRASRVTSHSEASRKDALLTPPRSLLRRASKVSSAEVSEAADVDGPPPDPFAPMAVTYLPNGWLQLRPM